MMDDVNSFMIIDTLYSGYTIVVDTVSKATSVYCDTCDEWVVTYEGDAISRHSKNDLYIDIIEKPREQIHPNVIEFS